VMSFSAYFLVADWSHNHERAAITLKMMSMMMSVAMAVVVDNEAHVFPNFIFYEHKFCQSKMKAIIRAWQIRRRRRLCRRAHELQIPSLHKMSGVLAPEPRRL